MALTDQINTQAQGTCTCLQEQQQLLKSRCMGAGTTKPNADKDQVLRKMMISTAAQAVARQFN